jgi:hypothetical protein
MSDGGRKENIIFYFENIQLLLLKRNHFKTVLYIYFPNE